MASLPSARVAFLAAALVAACIGLHQNVLLAQPTIVGPAPGAGGGGRKGGEGDGMVVSTGQLVHPAGESVEISARPVDMARSPDGRFVFLKENKGVSVIDAASWKALCGLGLGEDPASMTGLAVSADGTSVYVTDATTGLHELAVAPDGTLTERRKIKLPGADGPKENSFPCGVRLMADGKTALVCLSRNNSLGFVDLSTGTLVAEVPIGVAPFTVVVSPDESTAYVSVWGGRRPKEDEPSAASAGTRALIDARGIAASGGVSIVDLKERKEVEYVETGLSASGLALTTDGATLYVANSNNDTVTVIDTARRSAVHQLVVKPDASLPFGSMPSALALSPDQRTLYVACAGNNAVAVIDISKSKGGGGGGGGGTDGTPAITGWIPTAWYPGALLASDKELLVANIKGLGSRTAREDGAFNSRRHRGTAQRVPLPSPADLVAMTEQVKRDALIPQVLRETESRQARARGDVKPTPVPAQPGEPSTIEHVIYIIKENRTYDQFFGDLATGDKPRGNGKPELCVYGREVTPNHHALAEQFVLLDNYYCNGVLSADGHSWATEGNCTPYLERSFGGFKRSYTYGDDPLTYSSSGFIWDHVLAAGLSFRNFGEFAEASIKPPADGGGKKWGDVYADWKSGKHQYTFPIDIGVANVARYSDPGSPGWCLDIPDQIRADRFIAVLKEYEAAGSMPAFITMVLPNDHTNGVSEGHPTPRAYVADNDLAVGRIVEAVSHSKFWGTTAIFINEDDPQDGWDHVDGHRSICLVISPFAKRNTVVSDFYNQAGVVHTIERIFGLTAVNQLYAASPVLAACFTDQPDAEPYTAITPSIPLDEMNPPRSKPKPKPVPGNGDAPPSQKGGEPKASSIDWLDLYALTDKQDFSHPDMANEGEFNLVLWHAAKGLNTPYPSEFSGAHGKGLTALGLTLSPDGDDDDDEDEDDGVKAK